MPQKQEHLAQYAVFCEARALLAGEHRQITISVRDVGGLCQSWVGFIHLPASYVAVDHVQVSNGSLTVRPSTNYPPVSLVRISARFWPDHVRSLTRYREKVPAFYPCQRLSRLSRVVQSRKFVSVRVGSCPRCPQG
jgi:hypothetical protein